MKNSDNHSRFNKFEKRRKNTKLISILIVIGSLLLILLIAIWIFGGNEKDIIDSNEQTAGSDTNITINGEDENKANDPEEKIGGSDANDSSETDGRENDREQEAENNSEQEEDNDTVETEDAEPSDDNVREAYTGDWQPVGTQQQGPHTINYDNGSQDRVEIKQAVLSVTGLSGDDMIEHWIGRDGDQAVIATVSDGAETEIYRVYLSWVDKEGWQPTKVEELKENDKK